MFVVFYNISVTCISWWSVFYWWRKPEYTEKTNDQSQTVSHNVVSRILCEKTLILIIKMEISNWVRTTSFQNNLLGVCLKSKDWKAK
jgi:hypothetical protein